MLCFEKPGAFYNRFLYPIIFPSTEHRDFMANYLYPRQIDTSKPYCNIADVAAAHYGYAGDCPTAEQIAKRVLVIPSSYSLRQRDVKHIAQCVNEGWAQIAVNGHRTPLSKGAALKLI